MRPLRTLVARLPALRVVTVLALALSFGAARRSLQADEELAQAALDLGRQALAQKDFAGARARFERALEEMPELREAKLLLGEACLGEGQVEPALGALRELATELEKLSPLSEADAAIYCRARELLEDASEPDAELFKLLRKQATALAKIATKWRTRDASVAERAARAALVLAPDNRKAMSTLEKIRKELAGRTESLITGTSLAKWTWVTDLHWRMEGGILVAEALDKAMVLRTNRRWSGDYDVVIEAQLLKGYEDNGPPHFALLAPYVSDTMQTCLGYLRGAVCWNDVSGPTYKEDRVVSEKKYTDLGEGLAATDWIRYEIRVRAAEIIAVVNGVEIGRLPRRPDLATGYVALMIQFAKAAFRRVEVTQR